MIRLRTFALAALACLAAAAFAVSATAGASGPTAFAASKSCNPPKYPGNGYFTSAVKVSGTGCTTGKRVALAHYRCRVKHGKKGTCRSRVRGFKCSEKRNSIPTEINSRVTCRAGSKKVVFTYQQNI